jgi:hypothetical protein
MRTAAEAMAPLEEEVSDPGPMSIADITVLRRSSQLFRQFATRVKQFTRERTAAKLNARGSHRSFKVGDKVKFFCGTSSAEAKKLGRKAKHLQSYRPGVVIEVDSAHPTLYKIKDLNGRVFYRTLLNVAPSKREDDESAAGMDEEGSEDSEEEPNPSPTDRVALISNCPPSTGAFQIGDYIAAVDSPKDHTYWFSKVIEITHDALKCHLHGTTARSPKRIRLRPLFTHEVTGTDRKGRATVTSHHTYHPERWKGAQPWTYELPAAALPELVICRFLQTKSTKKGDQLTGATLAALAQLSGVLIHAIAGKG